MKYVVVGHGDTAGRTEMRAQAASLTAAVALAETLAGNGFLNVTLAAENGDTFTLEEIRRTIRVPPANPL